MEESTSDLLKSANILLESGKYYEVLEMTDQIINKKSTNEVQLNHSKLLKSLSFYFLGHFETLDEHFNKGLELVEELLYEGEKLNLPLLVFDVLFVKVLILVKQSKHKEVIHTIEKNEDIFKKIEHKHPEL